MHRYTDLSAFLYGNATRIRQPETTAKVIASEVAVGENTYYGSVRPIGDDIDKETKTMPDEWTLKGAQLPEGRMMETTTTASVATTQATQEWICGNGNCVDQLTAESPLPLQLFISSLSDALSYTSADTTGTEFRYNGNGGPQGSSILNVTPMGSTTKLITSETSSNFKLRFCGTKCFPIIGTLFMTISLTASLGNILRLPTTVFLHGGGTFLVAYISIALILGIPLTFLEITLGQFCQQGTTKLWRAVPLFKGIGVVKLLSCTILCLYYPILIVNTLFYTIWSVYRPLPTSQCITKLLPRFTSLESSDLKSETIKLCSKNETFGYNINNDVAWYGIEVGLIMIVWILIMLCIFKSANSFRISSCIIVPCALFIAVTLLIEGIQRNTKGIEYLINIKWKSLLSFDIWYTALIQFFFSTQIGLGNITTCAGRLYPKNNPFWTAVFYMLINMTVGIGFVCVVYMWIEDLTSEGNVLHMPETQELFLLTLIYDVMSHCYGRFSQVWAFMSYSLIIFAGLASLISLIYTMIVGITVETKSKWNWCYVSFIVCGVCFIASCLCLLPENFSVIRLFDQHIAGKLIITTTVLEVMAFVWFYGLEALANDFEFVLGYKLNILWKILWFLTPVILTTTEICSWFLLPNAEVNLQNNDDSFWLRVVGWTVYSFAWLIIIVMAIWQVFSQVDYNLAQKFISSTKPTRNWGPVDPIYRHCWVQWKKQYQATGEKDFTLRRRGTRDYTHSVKRGRHAGPVGMRYSVNPASNQNTLQYKMADRKSVV